MLAENPVRGLGDRRVTRAPVVMVQSIENGNREEPSSHRPGCGTIHSGILCAIPCCGRAGLKCSTYSSATDQVACPRQ